MLLHQAVGQVRLMTGREPDVEVMRAAVRAELGRRAGASA
jgi:shikimate dehydrogenase